MPMTVRRCVWVACVAGSLASAGCGSSKSVRYYVLSTSAQRSQTPLKKEHGARRIIRVGPVRLPAYLDRQQMVNRVAANSVTLAQYERWAEPLRDGVPRILVANLSALLPNDMILPSASLDAGRPDFRVAIDIQRFDGTPGVTAELVARWTIKEGAGHASMRQTKHPLTITVPDTTYEALARVESELLARLSVAIAADLGGLAGKTND